jgi:hypothetical protein
MNDFIVYELLWHRKQLRQVKVTWKPHKSNAKKYESWFYRRGTVHFLHTIVLVSRNKYQSLRLRAVWRILLALHDKACTEKVQKVFIKGKASKNLWIALTIEYDIISTYKKYPYAKNQQFLCKMIFLCRFQVAFSCLSCYQCCSSTFSMCFLKESGLPGTDSCTPWRKGGPFFRIWVFVSADLQVCTLYEFVEFCKYC